MLRGTKDFIQHAKQKGNDSLPPSVNGERIHKSLELQTERRHQRKLEQWDQLVYSLHLKTPLNEENRFVKEESPDASAYDLKSLKQFIRLQAQSIDGTRNKNACVETVRHYWNMFTGAWKWKYEAIPSDSFLIAFAGDFKNLISSKRVCIEGIKKGNLRTCDQIAS